MRIASLLLLFGIILIDSALAADFPRVFPEGKLPDDSRLQDLRNLNSYFPFKQVQSREEWTQRQKEIRQRILISQGLWPLPPKSQLNAVVHGKIEFDDYAVEKVFFESIPGHFVTGTIYRPKGKPGPFPAVLCPHGHWSDARFYYASEAAAKQLIASGAERFLNAARNHIQARCVQLARMGCIAFFYDMTGNCDSVQLPHRSNQSDHLDAPKDWGFFGVQADLRLQNMMGLQTWNSVRSIDFLLEQSDVDSTRIGVTGASGGGTQSMIIAAIDDRITAAMPCVMVSTSMQGGCTCENAPLMRIDQGNIDIAAAIAPRPLGLTAADDWTRELETKGYPALQNLYAMLGVKDRLTAVFHIHFPHNYNHVNRTVMYSFFNRHFKLGLKEPVLERDFELLPRQEMTVWNEDHPAPSGDQVGDAHEISLLQTVTEATAEQIEALVPESSAEVAGYRKAVGAAWKTILGRDISQVGDVQFRQTGQTTFNGFVGRHGALTHADRGEVIPVTLLRIVDGIEAGVVIWVSENGRSGLLNGDKVRGDVADLLRRGYTVIAADLFGQGEFLEAGKPLTEQRMWYQRGGEQTWHRYSGYTFGYNHPLFVQRTHDILSLLKYAGTQSKHVHLVGLGPVAGPLALAARSQAGATIETTAADVDSFEFASLAKQSDPMFVPGSVKYLDVAGLVSLCAPHSVVVAGLKNPSVAQQVYSASDATKKLTLADRATLLKSIP